MKYRAEIDGLRALAVIPVILFHAGFDLFSGGFVGVDVFFVISGYLITTIILSEMEKGTFSLVNFYERRARRILPALFLVMFVSLPAAYLWLLPADMKDFSQSLVAVSTFSSNILFWRETGYWETASELKPLLHTWSLAVEEQYYVLFPIFLMIMWRFRKRWIVGSFMLITAISLGVAQWGAYNKPSATFFLLPTRGWELAIGASIAFYFLFRKQSVRSLLAHKSINEVLSLVGLLMIGYAVHAFDGTVPFPSLYALVPTIGTGLIILFSSPHTLVGRLLGTRLLVGVGLISYSAYLWHYPLLAFARHRSLTEPSEALFLLLALISFPLAYISWRYVESPFRNKKLVSRKAVFTFTVVGSITFAAIGIAGHVNDGDFGRWPKFVKNYYEIAENSEKFVWREKNNLRNSVFDESKIKLLLVGDSNSGDFINIIHFTDRADKFSVSSLTVNSQCGNLYLEREYFSHLIPKKRVEVCRNVDDLMNESSVRLIKEADWVIFVSSWRDWEIERIDESNKRLVKKFGDKFWYIGNKHTDFNSDIIKHEMLSRFPVSANSSPKNVNLNNSLKSIFGPRFIDPYLMFCENGMCQISEQSGEIIQFDGFHLTQYGAIYFAKEFNFFIDKLIAAQLNDRKEQAGKKKNL